MTKKRTVQKRPKAEIRFEPNMVILLVAVVSVLTLMLFGIIATL